jgi:hypothetical protein
MTANLLTRLTPPGPFSEFNREERNAVATLYAALLLDGNLKRFTDLLQCGAFSGVATETFVEWTYLRDLWNHHSKSNDERRLAILDVLEPSNRRHLQACSAEDFNRFFGVAGHVSKEHIQSPGRWSVLRFAKNIEGNDEFLRTCRFKWAFNIKPDLMLDNGEKHLLCIEAKLESLEGSYPTSSPEKAEFARRQIERIKQTELQRHLLEDLLGYTADFRFLVQSTAAASMSHATVTWAEVFEALDLSPLPSWVRAWTKRFAKTGPAK